MSEDMRTEGKLPFGSDYMVGAHPAILEKLVETNLEATPGYGTDDYCRQAADRIREACGDPSAEVHFLVGGTQTNATVIDGLLDSYQGVIAAESGHISVHEAGAVEFCGHKVLTLPQHEGKLSAEEIREYLAWFWQDESFDHMVFPGMVYLSHPTEFGTLYSKAELTAIHEVCQEYHIPVFLDGARLAYALACPENDLTLPDLAKLCDVFYIGGTKCGALFGEAVVIPDPKLIPHFFTRIKQHGALLAKGRMLGIQFEELFRGNRYYEIGENGIRMAARLRDGLLAKGYAMYYDSPTNQIFLTVGNDHLKSLMERVELSRWAAADADHTVIRLVTSWATTEGEVDALLRLM